MNICADYDSLHYGIMRSEYVLDNGGGIYENLGMVNVVYTYSKGLETLLLPISRLPSYGFFLSFQIWMTLGTLITARGRSWNFCRKKACGGVYDTAFLHTRDHEHVHHCKDRLHDGIYAACVLCFCFSIRGERGR